MDVPSVNLGLSCFEERTIIRSHVPLFIVKIETLTPKETLFRRYFLGRRNQQSALNGKKKRYQSVGRKVREGCDKDDHAQNRDLRGVSQGPGTLEGSS